VISDENGCENPEDLSMLTKEKVFSIVGELWFENSPKLFEFFTDYMSIKGLKYLPSNTPFSPITSPDGLLTSSPDARTSMPGLT
jgi:hypothetical protein